MLEFSLHLGFFNVLYMFVSSLGYNVLAYAIPSL